MKNESKALTELGKATAANKGIKFLYLICIN